MAVFLVMIAFLTAAAPEEGIEIGEKAPDFSLRDADGREYQLSKLKQPIVLLIFGNSKTRKEADRWAEEVKKAFKRPIEEGRMAALQVGDVTSKPFFISRSFVIWWLKRNRTPLPMLLDWDGKVFKAYKVPKGKPMIYIIKGGRIEWKLASNFDKKGFERLKGKLEGILVGDEELRRSR